MTNDDLARPGEGDSPRPEQADSPRPEQADSLDEPPSTNKRLYARAAWRLIQLPILSGLLLFLPAGTFDYWQAWVFTAVFFVCSLVTTVYLAVRDPKLLARRMKVGPQAEREETQKVIMTAALICFAAIPVVAALDHRFGWSLVPTWVVLLGDGLIVLSYAAFLAVFRANSYGASTIRIEEGQTVISTGPYALVRHPMYAAAAVLLAGMPLALGSWLALAAIPPAIAGLVWRLVDEEHFLVAHLEGYAEYRRRVPKRLVPFVW